GTSQAVSLLPPSYNNGSVAGASSETPVVSGQQEFPTADAPPDACAIVLYGPDLGPIDIAGSKDARNIKDFLITQKLVPPSNVYTSGTAQTPPTSKDPPSTRSDLKRLLRLAQSSGCKKLYLYIAAHGIHRERYIPEEGPLKGKVTSYSGGIYLKGEGG